MRDTPRFIRPGEPAAWFSRGCMLAGVLGASLTATACGSGGDTIARQPFGTLDGSAPLVFSHRGASGIVPEETIEAYAKAVELGGTILEFDLVATKDGELIARHDPNLATSTDVAGHAEFASRRRMALVDGERQDGWFASDFTLAEIKTLHGVSTNPERPQDLNGKTEIPTFQELIDLAKAKSTETGRTISIALETKNPSYHRDLGLPLEDRVVDALAAAGWTGAEAPVYVQSFEPSSLRTMRARGLATRMVQLVDADGVNLATGEITLVPPFDRPWDWAKAGDPRLFPDMLTPSGLAEIREYADAVGPWKRYLVSVKGTVGDDGRVVDANGDGRIDDSDATTLPPTTLVADAHRADLFVYPFTFRDEPRRLARDYEGDARREYLQFYRLGVDGVFTDFTDTALAARRDYLRELGR